MPDVALRGNAPTAAPAASMRRCRASATGASISIRGRAASSCSRCAPASARSCAPCGPRRGCWQEQEQFLALVSHQFKTPLASLQLSLETMAKRPLLRGAVAHPDRPHALGPDPHGNDGGADPGQLAPGARPRGAEERAGGAGCRRGSRRDPVRGARAPGSHRIECAGAARSAGAGRSDRGGCRGAQSAGERARGRGRGERRQGHASARAVQDGEVELAVRDSGVGFRAADSAQLFSKFSRLHPGGRQQLLRHRSGALHRAAADAAVRRPRQRHSEGVGRGARFSCPGLAAPRPPGEHDRAQPRACTLVVEDDPHLAAGLVENLRAEGYAVDTAGDGRRARRAGCASTPASSSCSM